MATGAMAIKRVLDILIAVAVLLITLPLLLVVSVLIRIKLGSPVFFVQERPGLNGTIFKLIKFRSMLNTRAEDSCLLPDNQRLTSFGRFLRSTSMDELLPLYSDHQRKRHNVRPGVTGWAQVNGRNAISWEMKFDLDVWYVENHNIRLDCSILFKTLVSVIRRDGITYENQATTTPFQGSTTHR